VIDEHICPLAEHRTQNPYVRRVRTAEMRAGYAIHRKPAFQDHPGMKRPYAVLTLHLKAEGATNAAQRRVVEFLRTGTGAA
jgi:hypothetical protein